MIPDEPHRPKVTSGNKTFWGMHHLNGHLLCAVDVKTTGLDPVHNGIIEICVLPLDKLIEPHKEFCLFHMKMRPEDNEEIDPEAIKMNQANMAELLMYGFKREVVADLFMQWFDLLNLATGKRLIPLACNWPFDRNMIEAWLGQSSFAQVFDARFRDVQTAALYLNDCADARCEEVPFPKVDFRYLCSQQRIEHIQDRTAIGDCVATAALYRRMMNMRPGLF